MPYVRVSFDTILNNGEEDVEVKVLAVVFVSAHSDEEQASYIEELSIVDESGNQWCPTDQQLNKIENEVIERA